MDLNHRPPVCETGYGLKVHPVAQLLYIRIVAPVKICPKGRMIFRPLPKHAKFHVSHSVRIHDSHALPFAFRRRRGRRPRYFCTKDAARRIMNGNVRW
jgi:hypothetical protein